MSDSAIEIRCALISVSDKTGVAELASALAEAGVTILSTGGTAHHLREAGVAVVEISDYTGHPEILGGRVKSLHPKIHGGILALKSEPHHRRALAELEIRPIDLVVVNFYDFVGAKDSPAGGATPMEQAAESIDIGGPAMVRAAAKNCRHTVALTDPADYGAFLSAHRQGGGKVPMDFAFHCARKAFALTAGYDAAISNYLHLMDDGGESRPARGEKFPNFPNNWFLHWRKKADLAYGENPHQRAALYGDVTESPHPQLFSQVQGAGISYNNLLDARAAWDCARQFGDPAAVIVKHGNPCGVACADDPAEAHRLALAADRLSAYGGVIAFNREVNAEAAESVSSQFAEVVVAPQFCAEAKAVFAQKERLRLLLAPEENIGIEYRKLGGGVLAQTPDEETIDATRLVCATRQKPDAAQLGDLLFAWRVAKRAKSNAVVIAAARQTLGVAAGQMSRIDAAALARDKAIRAKLELKGAVAASDGFFPFPDAVELLGDCGVSAVIQPGGSRRDEAVIKAADNCKMVMLFTGVRHFLH